MNVPPLRQFFFEYTAKNTLDEHYLSYTRVNSLSASSFHNQEINKKIALNNHSTKHQISRRGYRPLFQWNSCLFHPSIVFSYPPAETHLFPLSSHRHSVCESLCVCVFVGVGVKGMGDLMMNCRRGFRDGWLKTFLGPVGLSQCDVHCPCATWNKSAEHQLPQLRRSWYESEPFVIRL